MTFSETLLVLLKCALDLDLVCVSSISSSHSVARKAAEELQSARAAPEEKAAGRNNTDRLITR